MSKTGAIANFDFKIGQRWIGLDHLAISEFTVKGFRAFEGHDAVIIDTPFEEMWPTSFNGTYKLDESSNVQRILEQYE